VEAEMLNRFKFVAYSSKDTTQLHGDVSLPANASKQNMLEQSVTTGPAISTYRFC
jgi:hypothetical protein